MDGGKKGLVGMGALSKRGINFFFKFFFFLSSVRSLLDHGLYGLLLIILLLLLLIHL